MATRAKAKWTRREIREHIRKIEEVIEAQRKQVKRGEAFTSVTAEDVERKLQRVNSPMIVSESGTWTTPMAHGATFTYNLGLYNPDPTPSAGLFAHLWVGSGNVDPNVGTFLSNVDPRFGRLTMPAFPGFTLAAGASTMLNFSMAIPTGVEATNYLGNTCLMKVNWHDVGTYLDRSVFVFTVV